MKKKTDKFDTILFGVLIGVALAVITMCIIVVAMPAHRDSRAVKYDLGCVAERRNNPLKECKQ